MDKINMMKSCLLIDTPGGHHHDFTFIPHNLCMYFIVAIAVFFMHEKNPVTKQGSKKNFLNKRQKVYICIRNFMFNPVL